VTPVVNKPHSESEPMTHVNVADRIANEASGKVASSMKTFRAVCGMKAMNCCEFAPSSSGRSPEVSGQLEPKNCVDGHGGEALGMSVGVKIGD